MKLLSRELGQKERRDVCKILENFAASLRSIHSQAIFKRVALLGGVEKTLKAMREVIWHAIDTFRKYTY